MPKTDARKAPPEGRVKSKQTRIYAIVMLVSLLLGGFHLIHRWVTYKNALSKDAAMLAQSLQSLLNPEQVSALTGTLDDLEKPEYANIKRSLSELTETTPLIRFAYLLARQNGNLIFLADSEPVDSAHYSPPGQIFTEATDKDREPFLTGKTVLIQPTSDRWGTWVSALVPVKDQTSGQILAVFGLDYPTSAWNARLFSQLFPDIFIVLLFLLLVAALLFAIDRYAKLKVISDKLELYVALYLSVFEQAPIGIAILNDKKFEINPHLLDITINPMFEKILGRTRKDLEGISWPEITHPEDLNADLEKFEQFKAGKIDGYAMQKRFIRPDGSHVWTYMKVSHLHGEFRNDPMHLCLIEDISDIKAIMDSLSENERSKSVLISNLPGMAYRCNYDREWTTQFVSDGSLALTGHTPASLIGNRDLSFNDLIAPEYRDMVYRERTRALARKKPFKRSYEIITADGERKWVLELGQGVFGKRGEVEALEGIILDITDQKKMENELRYNYEHDRETGLHNRSYLDSLLLSDALKDPPLKRAIISINLSTVQTLSRAYGFNFAQELIKKCAEILKKYVTGNYTLYQTYENRFTFYAKDYGDKNELWNFSRKIAGALEEVLVPERIGAGIGICEIDTDEELDLNRLSKNILNATDRALGSGEKGIGICFYDGEMKEQVQREETITQELADIASKTGDDRLILQYQPILDLKTNQICTFEALARLNSKTLGLVSPLEFIPLAEKNKLMVPIGQEIIRKALAFLKELERAGYDKIRISVNISGTQLLKQDFTKNLLETIEQMQISPSNVGIEITEETISSDYNKMNHLISELKSHGLSIAIDDFGTGYSSLARVKELKVDCLKIDKYFLDKLTKIPPDNLITGDIISIAHKLGHCAVAEGVEREEQRRYLEQVGCDKIQGCLISCPLDREAAIDFLRHNPTCGQPKPPR